MKLSPRQLQGLFLVSTLCVAAVVGWLGWRLAVQDRALARQRRLEQLEAAADRVTAALYRRLAEYEELLGADGKKPLPAGAVLVHARPGQIEVSPSGGLLYLPFAPAGPEAPAAVFAGIDALEFQRNDPQAAASALKRLAVSPDPAVRAAALARLGRNLRKADRHDEALEIYGRLAKMGATTADGLPAELVALEARCALFEKLGRRSDLEREAATLQGYLLRGEWRLQKAAHEFQLEQARQWLGAPSERIRDDAKAALAAAAEQLWIAWQRDPGGKGWRIVPGARPVLAGWTSEGEDLTALLAPAEAFEAALREAGAFPAALVDSEGRPLIGRLDPAAKARVQRATASTRLPWILEVSSMDDGTAQLPGRSWILGGGFALLVVLLAGAGIVLARVVSREIALARLQADFVAAVSHEFRSPLSSISQIAELLSEDRWPTPEHRRRGYSILARESARLKRLVEGLLDFARMEAGTAGYHFETVAPDELLSSVVDEFRAVADSAEIELMPAVGLPRVQADCEALRRALWNLLDNAVKYSPSPARIAVEAAAAGPDLAIRVRDQGFGIPASEQAQIFRKFYRGSAAEAHGVKGTGIGLAMVRHIVEAHGGRLHLESAPGQGSTFTIVLPEERNQ